MRNLQVEKASGPDHISAYMLKHTAASYCTIYYPAVHSNRPRQWKISMVVPIAKSTNLSNSGNYRPISLTCILCKVLEKHIRHLMQEHLQDTGQLSNNQWGFRSQQSTVSALATVTHDWFTALEAGKQIGAVFFDYQKPFDSVPHQPLIEKMKKMSFSSIFVSWVSAVCCGEWLLFQYSTNNVRSATGICLRAYSFRYLYQ